jgi:hypothetical protein
MSTKPELSPERIDALEKCMDAVAASPMLKETIFALIAEHRERSAPERWERAAKERFEQSARKSGDLAAETQLPKEPLCRFCGHTRANHTPYARFEPEP